jgi:uncharacterized tellurite resistance protein B-like protein
MLQAVKRLFSELAGSEQEPQRFQDNDYRLASAALLVHAAMIDGSMSDIERSKLRDLVTARFDLSAGEAEDLMTMATAAEQEAVDLYRFTSLLNRSLDEAGRQHVIEMMWQVAHADGRVTEFEDNLIWRAADLLHVPAQARIALRQRVANQRKGDPSDD